MSEDGQILQKNFKWNAKDFFSDDLFKMVKNKTSNKSKSKRSLLAHQFHRFIRKLRDLGIVIDFLYNLSFGRWMRIPDMICPDIDFSKFGVADHTWVISN